MAMVHGFPKGRCAPDLAAMLGRLVLCGAEDLRNPDLTAVVPAHDIHNAVVAVPDVRGQATAESALLDRKDGTVYCAVLQQDGSFHAVLWPHPNGAEQTSHLCPEALMALCTLSPAYIGFLLALTELGAGRVAWTVRYGAEHFVEYRDYSATTKLVVDTLLKHERSGVGLMRPWLSDQKLTDLIKNEDNRATLKDVLRLFDSFDLGLHCWMEEVEECDMEDRDTDIYLLYKRVERDGLCFSQLARY